MEKHLIMGKSKKQTRLERVEASWLENPPSGVVYWAAPVTERATTNEGKTMKNYYGR